MRRGITKILHMKSNWFWLVFFILAVIPLLLFRREIGAFIPVRKILSLLCERLDLISFVFGLIVSPLVTIFGERLRNRILGPRLVPISCKTITQDRLKVTRVLLQNRGALSAFHAEAEVGKIFDNGRERTNFIPVPLEWTHEWAKTGSRTIKNIHPEQKCYLDVCNLFKKEDAFHLRLAAVAGLQYKSLSYGSSSNFVKNEQLSTNA